MEPAAFDLPFADTPPRPPADADDELRHWLAAFGYGPKEVRRLLAWDPVGLTAYFHPWITDSEFALAAQVYSWMILFDDACDGVFREDPDRVAELVQAHLSIMDAAGLTGSVVHDLSPSQRAFHDIWRRLRDGMSSSWTARAHANWHSCLSAFPAEAANRRKRTPLPTADYLELRAETGGVKINLDMSERLRRAEIRDDLAPTFHPIPPRIKALQGSEVGHSLSVANWNFVSASPIPDCA